MSNVIGRAQGGGAHLSPYAARAGVQSGGRFSAVVGPILSRRGALFSANGLRVGLLVRAPAPEGDGYEETDGVGYERQPLIVSASSASYDINAGEVLFSPGEADWPVASHLGVFDGRSGLIGYGALFVMGRGRPGAEVVFGAGAIRFKRPTGPILLTRR